ncbi:type 4a pilus biogenesis protein PilO [Actinoplanes sp. NPDC049596]|uniref:type 4a pilus biogenesis protein PilO n=1 Tax=unclassified Actinoplanes TaxID=2626549 RepID=UPI00341C156D
MNQIWIAGGIAAIILLVAGTWLLLISPKLSDADSLQSQADDVNIQLLRLRKDVATLKAEEAKKSTTQAEVNDLADNLPETYGEPDFLRMLHSVGAVTNVAVSGFTMGSPAASGTVTTAAELPISLVATGTATNIYLFITALQNVQDRAVLVQSVSLSGEAGSDKATANLTMNAFCTTSTITDKPDKAKGRNDMCKTGN